MKLRNLALLAAASLMVVGLARCGTPTATDSDTGNNGPPKDASTSRDVGTTNPVPEDDDALCNDGIDNDFNGLTDCDDKNCCNNNVPGQGITVCGQGCGMVDPPDSGTVVVKDDAGNTVKVDSGTGSPENDNATCNDGVDNDNNGFTDCADFSCCRYGVPATGITVCTAGTCGGGSRDGGTVVKFDGGGVKENTNALCDDGVDNDGNGHTDCDDFSCCRYGVPATGITVCAAGTCGGGTRDGGTVVKVDGGTGTPENDDTTCNDGIDNDNNGFTDCADFSCCRYGVPATGVTVCTAGTCGGGTRDAGTVVGKDAAAPENDDSLCSNGIDDNGNGFIDCADFSCCKTIADGGLAIRPPGLTVCNEVTCFGPGKQPENTAATCSDGIDNDGNRYTDCADKSCCTVGNDGGFGPGVVNCEAVTCFGSGKEVDSTANINVRCSDGIDNNANGYTDCLDFDCCKNGVPAPGVTVCVNNAGKCAAAP
ncbi:MAG TPA: hypothetical protein VGK67_22290 [Myxococcales bacterium]|jgi:hypothetical protein